MNKYLGKLMILGLMLFSLTYHTVSAQSLSEPVPESGTLKELKQAEAEKIEAPSEAQIKAWYSQANQAVKSGKSREAILKYSMVLKGLQQQDKIAENISNVQQIISLIDDDLELVVPNPNSQQAKLIKQIHTMAKAEVTQINFQDYDADIRALLEQQ